MPIKPKFSERVKKAQEILDNNTIKVNLDKNRIKKLISKCLSKNHICGEVILCNNFSGINYEDIMKEYKTNNSGHIVWVLFTNTGHVAVVGAGKDLRFSHNKNSGTWKILNELKEKNKDLEWNKSEVILIPIRGLKSIGKKSLDNILLCRNGVEQLIGDCLIENNIPILNYYSHKNYCSSYWETCKKNNYRI